MTETYWKHYSCFRTVGVNWYWLFDLGNIGYITSCDCLDCIDILDVIGGIRIDGVATFGCPPCVIPIVPYEWYDGTGTDTNCDDKIVGVKDSWIGRGADSWEIENDATSIGLEYATNPWGERV